MTGVQTCALPISEIGYRLCTLVLDWVCVLEELATSSSFGDKTISLLMFTVTRSGHEPGSRALGLKRYQIFGKV